MEAHIEAFKIPGIPGWKLNIKLDITPDEAVVIWDNGMQSLNILTWQGTEYPFEHFYAVDRLHTTIWPDDDTTVLDSYRARALIPLLKQGFRQFDHFFMAENRKHPDYQVPWNFFDDDRRFAHTWVVAPSDSGKTTLLSALINEDLDKVERGEGSVLVIDSQNEHLGKYLPRLARFAPGGDLEGKLIYLTPSLKHPPQLNIFDFTGYDKLDGDEQFQMLDTAKEMLMFFIGAMFGETSGHMQNIIDYAFRALVLVPDPTVLTFKELLTQGAKGQPNGLATLTQRYPVLQTLDPDTAQFLSSRMFAQYGPSISSVMTRLDGITRNDFTKRTFAQPRNTLRLFELLKEPHVIIVNTDKKFGEEATGTFGRFILASLLQVVRKRTSGGLPCYVYADEAQNYIAQEEAVVKLIDEARRQRISLTFAHHGMSQIKLDTVRSALHRMAIRAEPVNKQKHHWRVTINNGDPEIILPPNINFEHMEQMPRDDWQAVLDDMHARFSPAPKLPDPPPENISPHAMLDEDATTER